jgi:hypothetical protein
MFEDTWPPDRLDALGAAISRGCAQYTDTSQKGKGNIQFLFSGAPTQEAGAPATDLDVDPVLVAAGA